MTMKDPIDTLQQHNIWRRGLDERVEMLPPKLIGDAIDAAIADMAVCWRH